jgi:hypothetical protein
MNGMDANPAPRTAENGFSVVEALIAAALLLVIAIGIIPFFSTAMANNARGNDSTQASNFTKTVLEDLLQIPFNNQNVAIPPGSTEVVRNQWWENPNPDIVGDEVWRDGVASGTPDIWTRRVVITQHSVNDAENGLFDTPLDGGADPINVHLRQIVVTVNSSREIGNPLGASRPFTLRTFKAF